MNITAGAKVEVQGRGTAQVNWVRDGMAGITFVAGPAAGGSDVISLADIGAVYQRPDDLSQLSDEELRARIMELRSRRSSLPKRPRKERVRQPAPPAQTAAVQNILSSLGPEELELLKAMLGGDDT